MSKYIVYTPWRCAIQTKFAEKPNRVRVRVRKTERDQIQNDLLNY